MNAAPNVLYLHRPEDSWDAAGQELAVRLEFINAATIVGADAECVAHVALGAARASCGTRRVVIADLLGDAAALNELAGGPGTEGLTDGFVRGQTLNEIARPVSGEAGIFILPTGRGRITEELLTSERWQQLARGFADVGALLLVATRPGTPALASLVRCTAGVIAVDVSPASLPGMQLLTTLRLRENVRDPQVVRGGMESRDRGTSRDQDTGRDRATGRNRATVHHLAHHADTDRAPQLSRFSALDQAAALRWVGMLAGARPRVRVVAMVAMVALVATVITMGSAAWSAMRGRTGTQTGTSVAPPAARQTTSPARATGLATGPLSSAPSSASSSAASPSLSNPSSEPASNTLKPRDTLRVGSVVNPGDSSAASVFAVELLDANSVAGASLFLRDSTSWPGSNGRVVGTVVPVNRDENVWYKVVVGAWRSRDGANTLLASLRDGGVLRRDAGRVVRVPYALVLNASLTRALATSAVTNWRARGIHAYALTQNDGSVRVFAGAFETPAQATALASAVLAAGTRPVMAFRTGSAY